VIIAGRMAIGSPRRNGNQMSRNTKKNA